MPNHWDSHTHSSGQLYSICSSEEALLNYVHLLQKWLLRSGWNWEVQQIRKFQRSVSTFYCDVLWLHIRFPQTMPFSAKLTSALLITWWKVSGVMFPGHHHQLDSPQPDYSSFSLLLMQMLPPHQPFQWQDWLQTLFIQIFMLEK